MKNWNTKYPNRFNPEQEEDYQNWRAEKLALYPKDISDLLVNIKDITVLCATEKKSILALIERANMCVFTAGSAPLTMESLLLLGKQLGVTKSDKSTRHKDADKLTDSNILNKAIPFTTRGVRWHTDSTYYGSNQTTQSLFLLCKQPAITGGHNKVLDNEILYILLRDKNPKAIKTLMKDHCFIYKHPKTLETKPELGGKVFWVNNNGELNFRFSFRKMDMQWSTDKDVVDAQQALEEVILNESSYVIEGRLETGMGLISNNVIHTREKLTDSDDKQKKRLLFRTRYYDRVSAY